MYMYFLAFIWYTVTILVALWLLQHSGPELARAPLIWIKSELSNPSNLEISTCGVYHLRHTPSENLLSRNSSYFEFSLSCIGCIIQIEGRGQYKNYKEQFYRTKSKNSAEVSGKSCCLKFRSTRVLREIVTKS